MSEWTWKGIMAEYDALKAERDRLKARVERLTAERDAMAKVAKQALAEGDDSLAEQEGK